MCDGALSLTRLCVANKSLKVGPSNPKDGTTRNFGRVTHTFFFAYPARKFAPVTDGLRQPQGGLVRLRRLQAFCRFSRCRSFCSYQNSDRANCVRRANCGQNKPNGFCGLCRT